MGRNSTWAIRCPMWCGIEGWDAGRRPARVHLPTQSHNPSDGNADILLRVVVVE